MSNFPYPGLRPFEREEIDIFFGRETHTDQLITRLGQVHFLAVVGPSGCGKSSLVRTGLLPGLESGFLAAASGFWRMAELRPGIQPMSRLAEALYHNQLLAETDSVQAPNEAIALLQAQLWRGPYSLHEILTQSPLPDNTNLLLLVDQFEEIFRYYQQGDKNEAATFVKLLLASSQHPQIYVVITMRSDFLGDCSTFYGLPEAVNQGLYLTPRLTRDQLGEAIELPAGVFGDEIEPALLNRLLNDAGKHPDQLPVIQHALMQMWRLARAESSTLILVTLEHYETIGGLENALSDHADKAYHELTSEQQRIAEILFRHLTERGGAQRDTRRPVKLSDVATFAKVPWEQVAAVVEVFRQEGRHFLTPPLGQLLTSDSIIDISHESLIRQWQRLKHWSEQEAEAATLYRRLEDSAQLWKQGKAALWRSPELELALAWREEVHPTPQWASRYGQDFDLTMRFLAESKAEQQREEQVIQTRRKITFASITAGMILALLLALFAFIQMDKADEYLHHAKVRLYHAKAQTLSEMNPTIALRLAEKARTLDPLDEEIHQTLTDIYRTGKVFYAPPLLHDGKVNFATFSSDGKKIVTASDNTVKVWDMQGNLLTTLSEHQDSNKHQGKINSALFSPNNQSIVTASEDSTAKVWNMQGELLVTLSESQNKKPQSKINFAMFSPNGQKIVTASDDNTVKLWDIQGNLLTAFKAHEDKINSAVFSPDGQKIVTASIDKTAKVWSIQGRQLATLEHTAFVNFAIFSPDSQKIVTTSHNKTAEVWNVQGEKLGTLEHPSLGHSAFVNFAAFSSDGQRIVTASNDKTAKVWDVQGNLLLTLKGHRSQVNSAVFSSNGQKIVTASDDNSAIVWDIAQTVKKGEDVDNFLKSDRLAKLTVLDEILADTITLKELSVPQLSTQEMVSNLYGIAQFYRDKAQQSELVENKRKYLQQAAIVYQRLRDSQGQAIKKQIAELSHSDSSQTKLSEKETFVSQQNLVNTWADIPLAIFVGLLLLIISRQQFVFFQHQQYLRLVTYSIVPVVILVNWLSFYEGFYYVSMVELESLGDKFWLISHLIMVAIIAGVCFFHIRKRFQYEPLRILLQLFCLILIILSLLLLYQTHSEVRFQTRELLKMFLGIGGLVLMPIFLVHYTLQPTERWKWLKKVSLLFAYFILFMTVTFLVTVLDNALAFYNPIPIHLRFLLLLVTGIVLAHELFAQFKIYLKQQKWLTMSSFMLVYSVILYWGLLGFLGKEDFFNPLWRIIFYSEISDALTLLLALIATGFATVRAIKVYQQQNYLKTGIYLLVALFLASSIAYYLQTYMSIMSFFTVTFGGVLLFIHVISRASDRKRMRQVTIHH